MKKIEIEGKKIQVKVADTPLKRAKGLSLRKKGKMLFKFPKETTTPIDMMLMRKSLHLYFLDTDKKVIHTEKAQPWYKIPKKLLHRPEKPYKYLLESFEKLDLEEGDKLSF